jgi:DNA-binding NtrC family response regulator
MERTNVVLYNKDVEVAKLLADGLAGHVRSTFLAQSCDEIRPTVAQHRAGVLVLDVEGLSLDVVQRLRQEFPALSIVCTHRLADEELWAEALTRGAADICAPRNTQDVVQSVLREQRYSSAAAA